MSSFFDEPPELEPEPEFPLPPLGLLSDLFPEPLFPLSFLEPESFFLLSEVSGAFASDLPSLAVSCAFSLSFSTASASAFGFFLMLSSNFFATAAPLSPVRVESPFFTAAATSLAMAVRSSFVSLPASTFSSVMTVPFVFLSSFPALTLLDAAL